VTTFYETVMFNFHKKKNFPTIHLSIPLSESAYNF
jgi:hypothetical protein